MDTTEENLTDAQMLAERFKGLIPFIDYQIILKQLLLIDKLPDSAYPRYDRKLF